jgi:hypothetical protein
MQRTEFSLDTPPLAIMLMSFVAGFGLTLGYAWARLLGSVLSWLGWQLIVMVGGNH